jgi:SAM-dependent methyltransferase
MAVQREFDPSQQTIIKVQQIINDWLPSNREVAVLEAGCGSLTYVDFGSRSRVIGIDISQEQLDCHEGLDERILGDLETYPLAEDAYDAIVCWNVFEHLRRPDLVLINFARALAPGGVAVIAVPNVLSLKVLLTKFTPYRFHVWTYRHLFRDANAGLPGHAPFPTTIPLSIIPARLRALAEAQGLQILADWTWEATYQRNLRQLVHLDGRSWRFMRQAVSWLTFGRLDAEQTEYTLVLHKPASRQTTSGSVIGIEIAEVPGPAVPGP